MTPLKCAICKQGTDKGALWHVDKDIWVHKECLEEALNPITNWLSNMWLWLQEAVVAVLVDIAKKIEELGREA